MYLKSYRHDDAGGSDDDVIDSETTVFSFLDLCERFLGERERE